MKGQSSSPAFFNVGMLCIAIISSLIAFESARMAREAVHLQAAQIQPQLDYTCTPITVKQGLVHFNVSVNNLGTDDCCDFLILDNSLY